MEFEKYTFKNLITKAESGELVLPNFQRDFVWKPDQQQMLLASFLVNLPIGTFLILEGKAGDFVAKEVCFQREAKATKDCLYLLDGQQRLSTIKNIFSNHYFNWSSEKSWLDNHDALYYQLQKIWYLDISNEENYKPLGYDDLRFYITDSKDLEKGIPKLHKLEPNDVKDIIGHTHIYKTKGKDQYDHPAFYKQFSGELEKKLKLSREFAHRGYIPLFDFLSNDRMIVKNCLKDLARERKKELKIQVRNQQELAVQYLGHLDPNIEQKYREEEDSSIDSIWEMLGEKWVEDVLEYFSDLFKSSLMIPTVASSELPRATSVFEYMNKGGTPLDTFDIMVAKFAEVGDTNTLHDQLKEVLRSYYDIPSSLSESDDEINYSPRNADVFTNKDDAVIKPIKELSLNFLCLITRIREEGLKEKDIIFIKKDEILKLNKIQIELSLDDAFKGLVRAIAFLQFRCGVKSYSDISYALMLLPIGIVLKEDENWNNPFAHRKIEFWYWTSLFSGRYREKQNQRAIQDILQLSNWVTQRGEQGGQSIKERQKYIFKESNYSDLKTLMLENEDHTVPKAIHNGILQYVLSLRPNDFSKKEYRLLAWKVAEDGVALNDHHIIPLGSQSTLEKSAKELRKQKNSVLNSPLNRTLITKKSNSNISQLSVERYMPVLNESVGWGHLLGRSSFNTALNSKEDYEEFVKGRFEAINQQLNNELDNLKG